MTPPTRTWPAVLTALALGLAATGARAGPDAARLLARSKDPLVREAAAQVLGLRGGHGAVELLARRLRADDDRWVRARCAEALGRIGAPRAVPHLKSALTREKHQRVRRMVAMALLRLGERKGFEELMWQLRSGTNHTQAEVTEFLVDYAAAPVGQRPRAWWRLFNRTGFAFMARRPTGAPAVAALGDDARLFGSLGAGGHRQLPALRLGLAELRRSRRSIPAGTLLLLSRAGGDGARARLGPRGVKALLARQPDLAGVAVEGTGLLTRAAIGALRKAGKLALTGLGGLDRTPPGGARLLLVRCGPPRPAAGTPVRAFALLP